MLSCHKEQTRIAFTQLSGTVGAAAVAAFVILQSLPPHGTCNTHAAVSDAIGSKISSVEPFQKLAKKNNIH